MNPTVDLVLDSKCTLGEGPWWDAQSQTLYWTDGFFYRVQQYDPATGRNRSWPMGRQVGFAVPAEDGRVVVGLQDGLYRLDPVTGALAPLSGVEREIVNNRPNDGKCDAAGRLWFGTMSMTANQPGREFEVTGSFYKVENGEAIKQFGDVAISNGIAWSGDNRTMYHIDSPTLCVFAFDFDLDAGTISRRRVAVRIPDGQGIPDGMTIDAEDMLWVAQFGGGRVTRWDPETGRLLATLTLPVSKVTSCCFGGRELDTLYITTAREDLTPEQLAGEPAAGGLFAARPGVRGRELRRYKD